MTPATTTDGRRRRGAPGAERRRGRRRGRRRRRGRDATGGAAGAGVGVAGAARAEGHGDGTADDPPNTVVHVPRAAQQRGDDEITRGQGLDPARGQEAAPPRGPRGRPPPPADRERGRVPGPPRGRRPGDGGPPARRPHPDRACSRTACSSSTTSTASQRRLDDRQRLPRPGAERPAVHGGGVRRHRQGPQRRAVRRRGQLGRRRPATASRARIEPVLKTGDSVLVQVTKDPIGHKGARLTSQVSLPGRFLVYVPRAR